MSDQTIIGGASQAGGDLIKDTTTQDFMADVVDASAEVPVLVDFWAPWCGPCKQLTPVLEKAVQAARGAVKLVKMNIDEHPQIPQQMGVQSIPAVVAFKDGRPLDVMQGAQPESQIKAFIERVAGPGAGGGMEDVIESANAAMQEGDFTGAGEIFAAVLDEDRENADALGGLAKCHIETGNLEKAEQILAMVPEAKKNATPVAAARASLELARQAAAAGDTDDLRGRVEADPNDHQARFDLALGLNAAGDREGALEELLTLMKRDREWNDDAARKQLVQFFEAWGPSDPVTLEGRRRLASLLFA